MEKFSVKKPFTILVAVIMVLLLGFVSITSLQTNLLPDISTPYLMVVTVYPGASPERVESEVSDVMENALGTVSGVENITATSAENYSLLLMKFAEGTDMNSAMVKTSNKVDQTASSLPSTCLTPIRSKKRIVARLLNSAKAGAKNSAFARTCSANSSAGRALVTLQRPLPVMRTLRPDFSIFSSSNTRNPLRAAVPAAIIPAAPAPTTITS